MSKSSNKIYSSNLIFSLNKNTNSLLATSGNNLSNNFSLKLDNNQSDLITLKKFPFIHLCNSDVVLTLSLCNS
jgi:hypothetical protein